MAETKKTTTTKKPTSSTKKTTTKSTTTRKPAAKKTTSTAKKTTPASTKKTGTTVKKTTTKKPTAKKSTAAKKPTTKSTTVASKKPATSTSKTTKKTATKKTSTKQSTTKEKTTQASKSKPVKKLTPSNAPRKVKTTKKTPPKVTKTAKQIQDEIVSKEAVDTVFEDKEKKPPRFGKRFYLFFSIIFYAGAFFYINSAIYDNNDYIQSALFAFALLSVAFLLIYFNIHGIIFKFFKLPMDYLIEQARLEYRKDLIVEDQKTGFRKRVGRYRTIFTMILYALVLFGLVGSQIYNGIMDGDRVIVIVTQTLATAFVYIVILCAWQYIFNIIPNLLEKSIDAKSGFILTLSALILIIYVFFILFNVAFLEELMIFILIIGFILLLGVNLNMIVGEFNIFRNLRNRAKQSKAVTRAVFLIFFSFHLYIMIYASVVAYSIYNQNYDSYVFGNKEYDIDLIDNVRFEGVRVQEVYDFAGEQIRRVYYEDGTEITDFFEHGEYVKEYYDQNGNRILNFYTEEGDAIDVVTTGGENYPAYSDENDMQYFVFYQGTLKGVSIEEVPHGFSDLFYYAVITISSIGYGDIHPNTNYLLPQFWGGFLSIYGITFYALSIGYVSNIAFMGVTDTKESDKNDQ